MVSGRTRLGERSHEKEARARGKPMDSALPTSVGAALVSGGMPATVEIDPSNPILRTIPLRLSAI